MMSHWFIAPRAIFSPRWQQAFAQAQILDDIPAQAAITDVVWLLLQGEESFTNIKKLSGSGVKVVAMTAIENPLEARQALEAGAFGYVHYLAAPYVLNQIAQVIAAGGLWLGAELMRQLVFASTRVIHANERLQAAEFTAADKSTNKNKLDVSQLSSREKAVAGLVALGKSNKEVARELSITERTVKAHLSAVFEKLNVRDRLQLALIFAHK